MCTHTRTHTEWTTKAANEQECPQISETARRLWRQGVLLLLGCCPQPTVPPNQTMARLAFPTTGVLILYSERGKKGAERRKEVMWVMLQEEKRLKSATQRSSFVVKAQICEMHDETVEEDYQWKAGMTVQFISQDKTLHIAVLKAASFRGTIRTISKSEARAWFLWCLAFRFFFTTEVL